MSSWMGTQQPWTPSHIRGNSKMFPVPLCCRDLLFKGLLVPLDGSGHSSYFPWSSVGQQQGADGAGRWESQGRYQGLAPTPGRGCRQGSPHQAQTFRRCWQAQGCGHAVGGEMLVAQARGELLCARVPASPRLACPGRWQQGRVAAWQCMGTCLAPRPWNNLQ